MLSKGKLLKILKTYAKKNNSNRVNQFTLGNLKKELETELTKNQLAIIEYFKTKLYNYMSSIMDQLSFRMSSITYTNDHESRRYKAELLKHNDDDYKLLLGSITVNNPNIMPIFKIIPVHKHEATKLKDKFMLLNGVKANRVNSILTDGYQQTQNVSNETHLMYSSNSFKLELDNGESYCEVDGVVKKLSFVFVSCSEHKENMKNKKFVTDSRGSCWIFRKKLKKYRMNCEDACFIPAYLMAVEPGTD